MNADVSAVQQAFADLEKAPSNLQALLRPVLMRAMLDPALMRQLASTALSQHLAVLGNVLTTLPGEGFGPPVPPLKTFLQFTIGEDVDDAEEAFEFVRSLASPLRTKVEGGITRALRSRMTRAGQGTISLVALARLLALAFENMPLVTHILDGGDIEPFLPVPPEIAPHQPKPQPKPRSTRTQHGKGSPHLHSFVSRLVEIVLTVDGRNPEGGQMFVVIGRVVEITQTYVVLETLRGHASGAPSSQKLLLGMEHVVAMSLISSEGTATSVGR